MSFLKIKNSTPTILERFGTYYIDLFQKTGKKADVTKLTDQEIRSKTNRLVTKGIILSSITAGVTVFPAIWAHYHFENEKPLVYWSLMMLINGISIIIGLYILFLIALRIVNEISYLLNMNSVEIDYLKEGLFSVRNILARTALELPDPELEILGIDPFKRVSKKNLLIIGLLYKAKIFLTNFILKNILLFTTGSSLLGIPVMYSAIPVECFWNAVVVKRIINEARLRLFGFALSKAIISQIKSEKYLQQLSTEARYGCLRAIGNAVVMTQNYHPNMIILMINFQQELGISEPDRYDDWKIFIETLGKVSEKEKYFLLDLFTVAAAFDGKISRLEQKHLREAYGRSYEIYLLRLKRLTQYLREGRYHRALAECRLDFIMG